jgi:hypothetical protein
MRLLGQVELKTAGVSVALSVVMWFGGQTWGKHEANENMRRMVEAHEKELKKYEGLPVEELKRLPARFEVFVAVAEQQAATVDRIEKLLLDQRRRR